MKKVQTFRDLHRTALNGKEISLALKEDIMNLNLRPGQMISENEVAELYQVSRTPVKNAFTRLESEGFIEVVPKKGTFVTLIDCEYIRAIIHMRYVMEVSVCKTILKDFCLQNITEKLEKNLTEQKQMINSGNISAPCFYEVDSRFHSSLFEHVGQERVWSIIQTNQLHYTRFRLLDTQMTARYNQLYQKHMELFRALCDRNEERFEQNMYEHLHDYLNYVIKSVSGKQRSYLTNF